MGENLVENIVPENVRDTSILLIDNDATSASSLTSMLEQFSYKVMRMDVANEAVSVIENHKEIKLVIANIEMPEIDSPSFPTALLHKDIPLILITPEIETKKASDILTKGARLCLKKPISENDIKNLWQNVLPNKSQESIVEEETKQIEAFRKTLKRQRTASQASLLRRRPFIETFTNSEMYRKRRNIANVEWNTKPVLCPIAKVESNVGRRCILWTHERHMKFLAALSTLGEKNSRPKSILRIMNDPNLTNRQVASHLQKYKAQADQINDAMPRNEWRFSTDGTFTYSSDYGFPFKAPNLKKFILSCNSLWYSLRKKNASSSSITQFSFENLVEERNKEMLNFHLGGKLDLSNHSSLGNVLNKSSMEVDCVPLPTSNNPPNNVLPTDDINHTSGLSSGKLPVLSGLPSPFDASKADAFQMGSSRIYIPQFNPKPLLETTRNQIDLDLTSIPDAFVPQVDSPTLDFNQMMDLIPSTENHVLYEAEMNIIAHETNTNHMGRVSSGECYNLPLENIVPTETNKDQMGLVSSRNYALPQDMFLCETNTDHVGFVSSGISYETNMTSSETNMTQVGCFPCETSYAAQNSSITPGTIKEEMVLDPNKDDTFEDLISFDNNFTESDMQSWFEYCGFCRE